MPTIQFLQKNCRAVVILSHKGRPKGFEMGLSLKSTTKMLSRESKRKVAFLPHFHFDEIKELVQASPHGSIFLLENLRFLEGEAENNEILAECLASLGDFYVNDAFAVSHRANASIVAITRFLKSYAGFEFEAEIKNLSRVMRSPEKPLVVVLGGAKIEDKLQVFENLKDKASAFLIGGALTPEIMKKLRSPKMILPVDFKKEGDGIRDIGLKSIKLFGEEIKKARTIIWNGPLGNIDDKRFREGTKAIAKSIAENKKAYQVIGGGETVMFLKKLKLDKKIDFISTGGGAMLEFLAGEKLPGIEALG